MLDERIKNDLLERYRAIRDRGDLLSQAQLDKAYANFRSRFGPQVLANLDGEELLTTVHAHGSRDSLVYWLEFKNDEEFPARFGSIAGGSAHKFGLYRSKETGIWTTGSPKAPREIELDEAVQLTRGHRDQLVRGAEAMSRLLTGADDATYRALQEELDRVAPDVSRLAWGHKYFSLLYPDKLDDYHNEDLQRFHLIRLMQAPPVGKGRYLCAGRYVAIAKELNIPMNHLTTLLNLRNGRRYSCWRVGTRLDAKTSIWSLMRNEGCVAIGWDQLGDLSEVMTPREGKERIHEGLQSEYPTAPGVLGRKAQEVLNFVMAIAEDDLVLAADGQRILGIGRVTGGYFHVAGDPSPHRRSVTWLNLDEWKLPEPSEGLQTTVQQIRKHVDNLIAIEQRLLTAPPRPSPEGVIGRIQAVLDRKRQVILYGPPGTGKTYWARLAANDLAARAAFNGAYDDLSLEQQMVISGDLPDQAAIVRMCVFHPAYGYEDFMEGYRPVANPVGGQLVFERRDGIFKRLCEDACKQPKRRFILIIDEINRGDIPRIFGELLTVLERDKRQRQIVLPLSGERFMVPDNVCIIGTMNTADRSIALLDTALRRRFGFVELMPDSDVFGVSMVGGIPLGPWLDALNSRIREHLGRDARNLQIGHAYLLDDGKPVGDIRQFARILQDDIVPLLEEYCYEDYDSLEKILGQGLVDRAGQRIRHDLFNPDRLDELIAAVLTPDVATSGRAIAAEANIPEEGADEPASDENDDDSAT